MVRLGRDGEAWERMFLIESNFLYFIMKVYVFKVIPHSVILFDSEINDN